MTKDEFLQRKSELFHQIAQLRKEYIESNTTIKPGRVVIVNNTHKVWLNSYTMAAEHIQPVFYELRPNGSPSKKRIYFSYKATIREA